MKPFRRSAALMVSWAWLVAGGAVARAAVSDQSPPLRSFERFAVDPRAAQGLWVQVATDTVHDGNERFDLNVYATSLLIAYGLIYGSGAVEGGMAVPYVVLDNSVNEHGFGDVGLYGKWIPLRTPNLRAGLGLEITAPSGDEHEGTGMGEASFLPFGTIEVAARGVGLRGHLGYRALLDEDDTPAENAWEFGGGLFAAPTNWLAVRVEALDLVLDAPGSEPILLEFAPGLDVHLPTGGGSLLLRLQGAVGVTDDAPDWRVGGGIAFTLPVGQ